MKSLLLLTIRNGRPISQRLSAILLIPFALLGFLNTSHARVPVVDGAVGWAIDRVLDVARASSLAGSFAASMDRRQEERVRASIARIRGDAQNFWRYEQTHLRLIEGIPGEPNAFCTGPTVYVSIEMAKALSDIELDAVIAHEMAHAEEGHLTERMSHFPSGLLVHLGQLIASDIRLMRDHGRADVFMQELWSKGHWTMIQELLESATLGQEMEADCYASRWLESMRLYGRPNRATDIASALSSLFALSIDQIMQNDPFTGARLARILSGQTFHGNCE